MGVEHDHHIRRTFGPAIEELTTRGDDQRTANLGEGDFVPSGQGLNGTDSRNYFQLELTGGSGLYEIKYPQGAVVERWIPPYEERANVSVRKF